jgi:hypothetical protein
MVTTNTFTYFIYIYIMLYYRMQIIVCFLVVLLGLVIAEKGQRGYSPAHNLRNYGTVEGRGLWLGGGFSRQRPSNGCYLASSPFSITSEPPSNSTKT